MRQLIHWLSIILIVSIASLQAQTIQEPQMVYVEGGTFMMGSSNYDDELPIHEVTLDSFYIGKYEITQKEWFQVMGSNPSEFKGDTLPVENVSWEDIQIFIQKLNDISKLEYRLPTEAEWEFAARGGNKSKGFLYSGSNTLDSVGYFDGNSENKTHPIGSKLPNELGIYDMSGNVWEWCSDWHDNDYTSSASKGKNPKGVATGNYRILRGGSWYNNEFESSVTKRSASDPARKDSNYGFRLVREK